MKKIILAGREGFGEFEDSLYFDFDNEPFADIIGFRWLEDTAGGAITDCDDLDSDYIEKIDTIIAEEKDNAFDCDDNDYRQIYSELYSFGLIDENELEKAYQNYNGSCYHDEITGEGREYFWSVESENNSYNNDEFNGRYAECVKYATQQGYTNADESDNACQISFIESEDGIFRECLKTVRDWRE